MPRSRRRSRTSGRLAMAAKSRALGPPRRPPHAPQSWADSCGLFRLVDPWPRITTRRAKPCARPAGPKTLATLSVFSGGCESHQQTRHGVLRLRGVPHQRQFRARLGKERLVHPLAQPGVAPRRQQMADQRNRRKQSERGGREPAAHQRSRGYERIPHQQSEKPPAPAAALQQHAGLLPWAVRRRRARASPLPDRTPRRAGRRFPCSPRQRRSTRRS